MSEDVAGGILEAVYLDCQKKFIPVPADVPERFLDNRKTGFNVNYFGFFLSVSMIIATVLSPLIIYAPSLKSIKIEALEGPSVMEIETYDTAGLIKGERDNTPYVLIPTALGTTVFSNDLVTIDCSNTSQGYIIAHYYGESEKVKLRITGPDEVIYTYNLATGGGKDEVFPLPAGDGKYMVCVYENLVGTQYLTVFTQKVDVKISDQFLPFLYPNQYVDFNGNEQSIALAEYLAYTANTDLDVVSSVYNAIISSITYDYDEAQTVESGYIPDIDEVLSTQKGICLDYAVLMTAMLRSQRIPTRMEVGYAGTAYHAWISTYITDVGWVNGIIEFDGKEWSLMDPTFASTTESEKLKNFIGDGENYQTKYIY